MNIRAQLYIAATLYALAGLGFLLATPVVATDGPVPVTAITFWWSRMHPQSYAPVALEGAEFFVLPNPSRLCVEPEAPYAALQIALSLPARDSILARVVERGSAAGRLYGLLGMTSTHDSRLQRYLEELGADSTTVRIVIWDGTDYRVGRARLDTLVSLPTLSAWLAHFVLLPHSRCST